MHGDARALSKLIRDYDQIRRMMAYLRWEDGDIDETVPSLYARRGSSRPKTDGADDETDGNDEPREAGRPVIVGAPSPTNGGGPFTA